MKKWQPLADDIFKYIILNEVVKKITEGSFEGYTQRWLSIGSGNGLVLDKRQTITGLMMINSTPPSAVTRLQRFKSV